MSAINKRRFLRRPEITSKHYKASIILALICALALTVVAGTIGMIVRARDTAGASLHYATSIQRDLETLLALHTDANADFLKSVAIARIGTEAWPVARAAAAQVLYDRLDSAYHDPILGSADGQIIDALRRRSGLWLSQLDDVSQHTSQLGSSVAVDSRLLLTANASLHWITGQIAGLHARQEVLIANMQADAEHRLARERVALLLAGVTAVAFLCLAILAGHRESLAKAKSGIVAHEADARFREYFEQHPLAMLIYDVETLEILTSNASAQQQYAYTADAFRGLSVAALRPQSDVGEFMCDLRRFRQSSARSGSAGLRRHVRADGTMIYVQVSFHFLRFASREACFITAVEVTEQERLRLELSLRGRALDAALNAVVITRSDGDRHIVHYVNGAFERITGFAASDVVGNDFSVVIRGVAPGEAHCLLLDALTNRTEFAGQLLTAKRDAAPFWAQWHVAPVVHDDAGATHLVTVFSDVTELMTSREQLRRQAKFDALTDLPNRYALNAALDRAVENARNMNASVALAFFDLDNFKDINDTLGHAAGDRLLREVALRFERYAGQDLFVARYGGDEFVAVFPNVTDASVVDRSVSALRATVASVDTCGNEFKVDASVGVAYFPRDGNTPDVLLRHADLALYRAKRDGGNCVRRFEASMRDAAHERFALSTKLRNALKQREFLLYYQPRVQPASRQVEGFEALLRWRDPERGLVSPSEFISHAEKTGLIVDIGEWVLAEACRQAATLAATQSPVTFSVNVSPLQFSRSDFPQLLARTLRDTGLRPSLLEIEVTEGVLMDPAALPALHAVRALGVQVAIDDFGTGYSSLAYVRSFRADTLKLDMSFVRGIGRSKEDEAIVKAILGLGETLGMRVVAEGVETREQLEFVLRHGCDAIQGYYFGRPMPMAAISEFLRSFGTLAAGEGRSELEGLVQN
ncbi:putative bifunctional diguanylate cyclase/phosphodiesterase [Caballeronia arvi]|nr:EAL domain-containing protein [Caballeronia arvi]